MKEILKQLIYVFILLVLFGCVDYAIIQNSSPTQKQLQTEVQQLQADNKKLIERVDANDAIVNRWLMEGGGRP